MPALLSHFSIFRLLRSRALQRACVQEVTVAPEILSLWAWMGRCSTQLGLRGTEEQLWKASAGFLLQLVTQISQQAQLLAAHMTHRALSWKPPLSSHALLKTNRAIFYIFQHMTGRFASWVSRSAALEVFHQQGLERTSSTEKPMVSAATSGIRSPGMGQLPSRKTTDWGDRKTLNSPLHTPEKQTQKSSQSSCNLFPHTTGKRLYLSFHFFFLPPMSISLWKARNENWSF